MRRSYNLWTILALASLGASAFSAERSPASAQTSDAPDWLIAHVGEGRGQIARPVLDKARALYRRKSVEGVVSNACYFAMDATRPNDPSGDGADGRFYAICEAQRVFRAMPAGHGAGRDLKGIANFANGKSCAKNFGNAADSELTAGGSYVTAETKTSFKGYYAVAANREAAFLRSFVQFDGEGETANARQRAIGGHAAVTLKGICLQKNPSSPYANQEGYVPFGTLVEYAGGRSNGCTSWAPSDVHYILSIAQGRPTTLYIYPDSADIAAVARAVAARTSLARAGLYWNAACLKEIRAPKFWPRESLEPILAKYRQDHPAPPPRPAPLCAGQ